jgi:hypothetical protein
MAHAVGGWTFFEWLEKQGLISDAGGIRQIVIVAPYDDLVCMYVERLASSRALDFSHLLGSGMGLKIIELDKDESEPA